MTGPYGVVVSADTLRFDRNLPHPPDVVWEHITDRRWLPGWLAPGEIEPRVGGAVTLQMNSHSGDSVTMHGRVTGYAPPSTLAYTWRETSTVSRVAFELSPVPGGCQLVVTHEAVPHEEMLGFGHGWHACLDALGLQLAGGAEGDVRIAWIGDAIDKEQYRTQLAWTAAAAAITSTPVGSS